MSIRHACVAVVVVAAGARAQWTLYAASPWMPGVAVHDEARSVVVAVLHGATSGSGTPVSTWELDANGWRQAGAGIPGAHLAGELVLVYDPVRRRVLGIDHDGPQSLGVQIYAYGGAAWTPVPVTGTLPQPATDIAAAFDRDRARLVLQRWDETWEWDGAAWSLVATTTAPGRVDGARMAFDAARGRCVLAGGRRFDPVLQQLVYDANTYEWDGATWTAVPSAVARTDHAMAFDAVRGRVVMYGGVRVQPNLMTVLGDMREWDGSQWSLLTAPFVGVGTGLLQPALACDVARGRLVLAGRLPGGSSNVAQEWELVRAAAPTWSTFGDNCTAAGIDPRLSLRALAMPVLGRAVDLELRGVGAAAAAVFALGFSDAQWNGAPLPLDLTAAGLPGCAAWIAPDALVPAAVQAGVARLTLTVPNRAALLGLVWFAQGIVPAPGANPAGQLLSDAARLRAGQL